MNIPGPLLNQAMALHKSGQPAQAEALYREALKATRNNPDILRLLGMVVFQQGRPEEASSLYEQALAIRPGNPLLLNGLGDIRAHMGDLDKAIECYENSLMLEGGDFKIRHNLGELYQRQQRFEFAAEMYRQVLAQQPGLVETHFNLAGVLVELGDDDTAIRHYQKVLELNPQMHRAMNNLGSLYLKRNKGREALELFHQAFDIDPLYAEAIFNAGSACEFLKQREQSCAHYKKAHLLQPTNIEYAIAYYNASRMLCRWEGLEALAQAIINGIRPEGHEHLGAPFKFLTVTDDPALNLVVAQRHARRFKSAKALGCPDFSHAGHKPGLRLKVGYVSGSFYQHPTLQLIAGVLRRHDYQRFEFFFFSSSPVDGSDLQQELMNNPGTFIDINTKSDLEAAQQIHDLGIDVLVDLNGYSQYSRPGVFALRPAPIQITYLAYPATTGADFFDYVLTDRVVIPPDQAEYHSEQPVYLTGAYHCYDNDQPISDKLMSRREFDLPQEGFVFCSFNQAYKLDRQRFATWMRILTRCDGSVLWLYADHEEVRTNLQAEAKRAGVPAERLVFTSAIAKPEHLKRLQLADLMLDTDLYNGHTTTLDAMWAGLPVLTKIGRCVASRVSAAQLWTIGLDELVTESEREYEELAVRLAHDGELYEEVRSRLSANRYTTPLFDTAARAREMEDIYVRLAAEIWRQ